MEGKALLKYIDYIFFFVKENLYDDRHDYG